MFNKLQKIKYGKYIIEKIDIYDINKTIKDNTIVKYDNNILKLELKNTTIILKQLLDKYTNINDFIDIENEFNNILITNDKQLKKVLRYFKNIMVKELKIQKKELEKSFYTLDNNIKKINNMLK
ncbi:hypothetical protein FDF26_14055 [Clostridium botulinum]|nr:hypothetical protein [Clostridium botulinum]